MPLWMWMAPLRCGWRGRGIVPCLRLRWRGSYVDVVRQAISILLYLSALCFGCAGASARMMSLGDVHLDGSDYTGAEVIRVEPDGLVISHSAGVARIRYEKLPPDLQKVFNFDPVQAQAHRAKKAEAAQAARQAAQAGKDVKRVTTILDDPGPYNAGSTERPEAAEPPVIPPEAFTELGSARAADQGVDEEKLYELAKYIRGERRLPIFSLLISRNGKLIFELYTGDIDPEASHYLMSVTKSMMATLIGIALDQGILSSEELPLSEVLPDQVFKNDRQKAKFSQVSLKNVMEMSALDALVPPHDKSARAALRGTRFIGARNRLVFALDEDVLQSPGSVHQYNDVTPALASSALSYASGQSAFDFARKNLFEPLGFRNAEWMHQDGTGIDMGGYGLRLRPIDMQKWGALLVNRGLWGGRRIISEEWIAKAAEPSISAGSKVPNYGWFWWRNAFGTPLDFQVANGWKGQRLAISHDKRLVVSMTACIESEDEHEVFGRLMRNYIVPAVDPLGGPRQSKLLDAELTRLRRDRPRYSISMEERMIPSVKPKEKRKPFAL
jgi:CubicO group peptidase (beta-lactamase class C family)